MFPSDEPKAKIRGPQELGVSLGRRPSRASGVQDRTRPSRQERGKQEPEESKNVFPSDERSEDPRASGSSCFPRTSVAKIRGSQESIVARDPRVKREGNNLTRPSRQARGKQEPEGNNLFKGIPLPQPRQNVRIYLTKNIGKICLIKNF